MKGKDMIDTISIAGDTKTQTGQTTTFNQDPTKPLLKVIKLGGDVGATKNMVVYECGDDMIIVDCGIGFPDSELHGVDVVIPDVSYVVERKHKLRGIFVTHAHEDHIGAIPYVIDQLGCPIYSGPMALGLIKEKMKEKFADGVIRGMSFNVVTPDDKELILGNFRVKSFGLNHSVPGGMGYAIRTPQGLLLHIPDYKIDWTPIIDKPIELGKIAKYGDEGVLCMLSDCLGVTHEGYAASERNLNNTFIDLFGDAEGRQILVTAISSNISRMYQIINGAIKNGRKVVFSGRSIEQSTNVARGLKYLPFPDSTYVSIKDAKNYKQDQLVYIIAGCYGQSGSGLERVSRNEHNFVKLQKNAMVVISADPNPPGVQEDVERLLHNLTLLGADLYYSENHPNLHVSGHGLRGDITTVTALSKAKYYIPIGGTAAHMHAFAKMVATFGVPEENVFGLLEGETLSFDKNEAKRSEKVEVRQVYISGDRRDELSPIVVRDREQLADDGVFVVMIPVDKAGNYISNKLEIVTRGFVYVKDSQDLMTKSKKFIREKLGKLQTKDKDWNQTKRKLENEINRMLYKELGREPLTIVHTLEV
jgi:ribonuclease J